MYQVSQATEGNYKLEQLADRAGVSPRTVRYYVQRGLLPAPVFRGRDTAYSTEHLVRLRAIRRLQDQFLPLDAIQAELERRSMDEINALADGAEITIATHGATGTGVLPSVHRGGHPYRPLVPMVPMTPQTMHPMRVPAYVTATGWTRIELAPGLEIHIADNADANTRIAADELRADFDRRNRNGG